MSSDNTKIAAAVIGGVLVGSLVTSLLSRRGAKAVAQTRYSLPDQIKRFAGHKAQKLDQVLNIDKIFNGASYKGKNVLVTGANRGIGLAVTEALVSLGSNVYATVRTSSPALEAAGVKKIVSGVDVTSEKAIQANLIPQVAGISFDIVINNAGYFYGPKETIDKLNFDEELNMIDICAVGPLRVTAALFNAGLIKSGGKVAMITSQGGSIEWRTTQCPNGGDYGHHMSKAAANMAGRLLALELKSKNIGVSNLHPGFNRTEMTSKYLISGTLKELLIAKSEQNMPLEKRVFP
jgi:NAD(P)-dependent dehydrogenase (short-subunit alcohol dehydrogenase family)